MWFLINGLLERLFVEAIYLDPWSEQKVGVRAAGSASGFIQHPQVNSLLSFILPHTQFPFLWRTKIGDRGWKSVCWWSLACCDPHGTTRRLRCLEFLSRNLQLDSACVLVQSRPGNIQGTLWNFAPKTCRGRSEGSEELLGQAPRWPRSLELAQAAALSCQSSSKHPDPLLLHLLHLQSGHSQTTKAFLCWAAEPVKWRRRGGASLRHALVAAVRNHVATSPNHP